jgi:hypothetical protein
MTTKLTPAMTAAMFTLAAPASDHRRAAVAQRTRYALVARGLAEIGGYYLTEAGRAWIKARVDEAYADARANHCSRHGELRAGNGCTRCNAAESDPIAEDEARREAKRIERYVATTHAIKVDRALTPSMRLAMWMNAAPTQRAGREIYPTHIRTARPNAGTRAALVRYGLLKPYGVKTGTWREFGHDFTLVGLMWLENSRDSDHHHALSIVRRAEMSAPGYELDAAAVNVLRFYSVSEYGFTPTGPVSAVPGTSSGLVALGLLDYRPGKYVRGIKDLVLTPAGRAAMLAHDERLAYADERQTKANHGPRSTPYGRCMHCDADAITIEVAEYGDPRGPLCARHARPRAALAS